MARPEPKFWAICWWILERWGNVESFRGLAEAGLPLTTAAVTGNVTEFIDGFLADPTMFVGEEGRLRFRENFDREGAIAGMAQGHLVNAARYLDSAVLIFGHSILDETVAATSRLVKGLDPAGFHAAKRLPRVEHGSLPQRLGFLIDLCRFDTAHPGLVGYTFSMERLEKLDQLRHDVVHGHKMGDDIGLTDADVDFLRRTAAMAWRLPHTVYSRRMPEHFRMTPPMPRPTTPSP